MIAHIDPRESESKASHAYWEGFFSEEELQTLIDFKEWQDTTDGQVGRFEDGVINETARRSQVSWLYPNAETQFVFERLTAIIGKVNSRFFQFDIHGLYEPLQLTNYNGASSGHYDWHTDMLLGDSCIPRKLTMVLSLSDPDEFEGGELQIKATSDEVQSLELRKGRAWFFPSWVLHRVTPVTKGTRKSVVVWAGGPSFR